MATNPREELIRAVSQAKDQAKTILAALEQQGHPQTNESNGVYFGLVTILKQLRTLEPNVDLAGLARELDRKSTRLNSSHSQISYAVFCLKKKKKKHKYTTIYIYIIPSTYPI